MDIIECTDRRLSQVCTPFDFTNGYRLANDEVIKANDLFELLKAKMIENRGVGLSAPQLGIMTRVFVIGNFTDPNSVIGVFNPTITNYSDDKVTYEEGCLSFPGLFIKISRPKIVRVRYTTTEGEPLAIKYEGYTSRVFQHEYDHLDGILFTKRANKYHLDKAKKFKRKIDSRV